MDDEVTFIPAQDYYVLGHDLLYGDPIKLCTCDRHTTSVIRMEKHHNTVKAYLVCDLIDEENYKKINTESSLSKTARVTLSENIRSEYEIRIFKELDLLEDTTKYIYFDNSGISIKLPLTISITFSVENRMISPNVPHKKRILDYLRMAFEHDLYNYGFECITEFTEDGVVEFYKSISNEDELKAAIKSLIRFKKYIGI